VQTRSTLQTRTDLTRTPQDDNREMTVQILDVFFRPPFFAFPEVVIRFASANIVLSST
jgi:hypothetical protein